jgi:hypothetical protein
MDVVAELALQVRRGPEDDRCELGVSVGAGGQLTTGLDERPRRRGRIDSSSSRAWSGKA